MNITASLLFMSAASQAAAPLLPATPLSAAMDCASFRWEEVGEEQRGAILVPITLDGKTYEFQLDTGADLSTIPESVAVEAGLMKSGVGGARAQDVRLGGASVGPRWLLARDSIGTVGLDMLVGFTTVIDYPAQRFCVTPTADLPYDIYRRTAWSDAVLREGKLFVPVEIAGQQRLDFFFDTGASLFPLSTDLQPWRELTGRSETAAENRTISGTAWGANVDLIGAPSLHPVRIATLRPSAIEVFYRVGSPTRFADYPFEAAGLIGNAGLWGHTVVLALGSRPQFGIVRTDDH